VLAFDIFRPIIFDDAADAYASALREIAARENSTLPNTTWVSAGGSAIHPELHFVEIFESRAGTCAVGSFAVALCLLRLWLTTKLHPEFGWRRFMRYGSDPVRQALYPWLQDFWVFFRLDLLGLVLQIVIVGTRLLRPPSSSLALFTAFPMFILLRVGQQTAIWYSVRNEYPRGALTCAVLRLVLPASFAGYITYALRAYPLRYDDLGPSLAAVLEKRDRQQAVLMYVGCWVAFAFEVALGYKAAMLVHAGVFGHGLEGSSVCRPVLPGDVTAELDPAWLKSAQTVLDGLEMKMSFRRVCSNKTHRSNTAGHHLAYHHQQHAVRTLKRQQVGQILKTSVKIGATPSWGGAHDLVPPPRHQFQRRFVQASYELGTLRWTLRHYTWIDALIDVCIVHKYLLVLCNEHDGTLEIWLQPPDDATMRSFQQGLLALTKCWPHPLTTERPTRTGMALLKGMTYRCSSLQPTFLFRYQRTLPQRSCPTLRIHKYSRGSSSSWRRLRRSSSSCLRSTPARATRMRLPSVP
jgi:hypothetical protein